MSGFAHEIRLGDELQVNAYTTGNQTVPSAAASASGDFVIAWQSSGQDGNYRGVFARRPCCSSSPTIQPPGVETEAFLLASFPRQVAGDLSERVRALAAGLVASLAKGETLMRHGHLWSSSLVVLAVLSVPLRLVSQEIRLGAEFQVNTFTTSGQYRPSVAASASGDFVVAWYSDGQDGWDHGVFARRFSSDGSPLGVEFQVNAYTTGVQYRPSVAASASGDFVVAWSSNGQDGSSYGVFARRFSSSGARLADEFQVNTRTISDQNRPSVAASASGDFVVAWQSESQDGSSRGVFARRFSSAGSPLATEFQVNTYTNSYQDRPAVAADADGDFVVAWSSSGQDGQYQGVFARRFSSAGSPLATEFQVNTYTSDIQYPPSVATDADGDFVVAWNSYKQDGHVFGVFARHFSSDGTPLATEFQVNTYTNGAQYSPSVAASASGDFIVAWASSQDGSLYGVFARRFSSAGAPIAAEFQVNTYTDSNQSAPSVAAQGDIDFVVAWQSLHQDGLGFGVFAQRAAVPATLDIDADGSVGALTDGLLVLRYLFGFTGSTLVTGAVGGGCTRCDAGTIETYLATLM